MAQRLYLSGNPPRLITSKPGYNASPSLADEQKTFDSDWFYGGGIKWHFTADSLNTTTINFPYALNYIPSVVEFSVMDMSKAPMREFIFWPDDPAPPPDTKGVYLTSNANVGTTSIYNIPLVTNTDYNYIAHFFVFEA